MQLWHACRLLVIGCVVFRTGVVGSLGQECRVTTTLRVLRGHDSSTVSLAPEELRAKIGGSPARVVSVTQEPKPVTVLLVDISSSMKEMWEQSVAAAKQLSASAGERVAVVVFREQILGHASGREPTDQLLDRLASLKTSMGGTALYDTLIEVAGAAKYPNTALVVISDGEDNASRHSSDQTVDSFLKHRWPPVFGLVLDYAHDQKRREYFKKIVAGTGGVFAYPSSASKVAEAASELSSEINAPFTITLLAPQSILRPQKLKLEVVGPDGRPSRGTEVAHVAEVTGCDETPTPSTN
jgi:Mg-chelatase subunit ChlD